RPLRAASSATRLPTQRIGHVPAVSLPFLCHVLALFRHVYTKRQYTVPRDTVARRTVPGRRVPREPGSGTPAPPTLRAATLRAATLRAATLRAVPTTTPALALPSRRARDGGARR